MAAENKAKTAPNDPKKRKRCYLPHNKPVRKKGPSPIRPGVQGFFITCDGGREFQAAQEAINVIDSFFEELIHGKCSGSKISIIPEKPMNKKITFAYSDSEEEDGDDDADDGGAEDNKSNKPENRVDGETILEDTTYHTEKDDQSHEVGPEETAVGNKEADKEQADKSNEEIEEPPEKKPPPHQIGSEETTDGDKATDKEQADKKNEETVEPPEKKQCCDVKKPEGGNNGIAATEQSVDKLIEAELRELGDKSKRRFSKLDTGCNGVVFINMRKRDGDPGPRDIVQYIMESAATTKKHMSRFLLRVLPVEVSCYASEEDISRAIKPLTEQYFPADAETPVKFAVQYDARANSGVDRMKIIDAVAKSVPEPHKVDLKNPEKTIIAQVIKTVCMIGVVEKYKELAKFNLRQLTS